MSAKRVLIVEDHLDGAEALRLIVEIWGHVARVALDGRLAVDCARTFLPEIVIMDINMPVMDGYQAARLLRAANDQVLLIAMTGAPNVENRARARSAGFHHHYVKPLELFELKTVLDSDSLAHLEPGFSLRD